MRTILPSRMSCLLLACFAALAVFPYTRAVPVVTGISHSLCSDSGDVNDADIYGCPVTGGGVLTVTGTGFSVDVVNITSVCANAPTYVSSTRMTCSMKSGPARSVTSTAAAVLSNGTEGPDGPRIHYAYMPLVTGIAWNGVGCLRTGSSFPYIYTRCPFDGVTSVTIYGSNFQNIGPLAGVTFYTKGTNVNLCNGNMALSLSQTVGGGIGTSLTCPFIADPAFPNGSTITDGILFTNGGNFSIFSSLTFNAPPKILLLEVPTSTQVTPKSVVGAPTYHTQASPGSLLLGMKVSNLVQGNGYGSPQWISATGCNNYVNFDNVDIINCTVVQGAGTFLDIVVYNAFGFGSSLPNAGANLTVQPAPTVSAIRSDWCFQDSSSPMILYNCPIYDSTFLITIIGTNFDRWFVSDVCVPNTLNLVNSTYAICNFSTTDQNHAGASRDVYISTNGVWDYWWNTGAQVRWAPRPTFSSFSMLSCFGSTTKVLTGCPVNGSYISLNSTQYLTITGSNFYKAPSCITIDTLSQTGAKPCKVGTMRVVTPNTIVCEFNLQFPLDTMVQTSVLVAGGWTDISTGGGGMITFAPAPTVTVVDIPLCTFDAGLNKYTNCPFDGHSPNITVTGTEFDGGPTFTTIMLTELWQLVCSPTRPSLITSITGANAYTTMTCLLIADESASGGTVLPAGYIWTNGGKAAIWTSLTYAMWPEVLSISSNDCLPVANTTLSLYDCPVNGNYIAPAIVNLTTTHLQPDSVVTMADSTCQTFARDYDVNHVVCTLNYTSVGGITATTIPLKVVNPVGYGYTRTVSNLTFARVPQISTITLPDCEQSGVRALVNCPVNSSMSTLTITGTDFTSNFNISSNVCTPGSLRVNSTTSAYCSVPLNSSDVLSVVSLTSNGVAGYLATAASIRYAPLPTITGLANSMCTTTSDPRVLSSCPLLGSTLTILGTGFAVGPRPAPMIKLNPNPYNIDPCVVNTTGFNTAGTRIYCQIIDLSQNSQIQLVGLLDNLSVTTTGGTSLGTATLTFQPLPVITSLSSSVCANNGSTVLFGCPVYVDGSAMLTINGLNFLSGSKMIDSSICTTGAVFINVTNSRIICPLANFTGLSQVKSIVIQQPALYGSGNSTILSSVASTSLSAPTVTGFYNRDCGQASDGISLIGCPTLGGGLSTLTVIGTNFDINMPTIISNVCESPLHVVNMTYGTCFLAANAASSQWVAKIFTNGGFTVNSQVTLQYAVAPILNQVLIYECVGNGTGVLSECPTTGGQRVWFIGSQFIGNKFEVTDNEQIPMCQAASIIVHNSTTASCSLAASSSYIGTTLTNVGVVTYGGRSSNTVTVGFIYSPVVASVSVPGCQSSFTNNVYVLSACPFDPLYQLSITIQGTNFTQGLMPQVNLVVNRNMPLCDAGTLTVNRTSITCVIAQNWLSNPGSSVPVAEISTLAGYATLFSTATFANRVSITSIQSSQCIVAGSNLDDCPVEGNPDSPFQVVLNVLNMQTSTPQVAGGVCSQISVPSAGQVLCTVNDTLAVAGSSLPFVLIDAFGYWNTSNNVAQLAKIAEIPSVSTLSGMDSACKQNGMASLLDCPVIGGNAVVFNGLHFDASFRASICDPTSINVLSTTQATCRLIANIASYSEVVQISTHGTAGWINSTAFVSYASVPQIFSIASTSCNQSDILELNDCPLKQGADLNITGQFLNSGALTITTIIGSYPVCITSTLYIAPDGSFITCTMTDFTNQLPLVSWPFVLASNGGVAPQNPVIEWWPLPVLLSVTATDCRSFDDTNLVDCPLQAGIKLTVTGLYFRPTVSVTHTEYCSAITFVNETQFVCTMAYLARSAVKLIVVDNSNGFGESDAIATVTGSPLTFPIITAFNSSRCSPAATNAGSLFNCSDAPGQILTITGNNFDMYNPVYVFDVCGADGPVAINVVSTELAYCNLTTHNASYAGGTFSAHVLTNGGEAIFPRVTITWCVVTVPVAAPPFNSSSATLELLGLPANVAPVDEGGNLTLYAFPQGFPLPTVTWQVSYDNTTWVTLTNANGTALNGTSLLLNSIDPSMFGWQYRAVYTNLAASLPGEPVSIYVQQSPRSVVAPPLNSTLTYGSSLVLNSSAFGYPVPQVQWEVMASNGSWVVEDESNVMTDSSSVPGTVSTSLHISNQTQYLQNYRVCYSNPSGRNCSTSVPVYAQQFPRNIQLNTTNNAPAANDSGVTVEVGNLVTLTSDVYGFPVPQVQWYWSNDSITWTAVAGQANSTVTGPASVSTNFTTPWTNTSTVFYRVCYTNDAGTNCSTPVNVTTVAKAPAPPSNQAMASSMSDGDIAAAVVCSVIGALLLCLCCFFFCVVPRKRRHTEGVEPKAHEESGAYTQQSSGGGENVQSPAGAAQFGGGFSYWIGHLCGLAEPTAKEAGQEFDVTFQA